MSSTIEAATTADRAATADETRPAWITLAEAQRITRRHHTSIMRLALAGTIAVKALAGARTLYNRADCERCAATD